LPTGALSLNASSLNNISSPLSGLSGQVSSLVSGLTSSVTSGISGAVGSITDAQKAQATADFAKAQATITAGLGKATASASNMAAKAQESLGLKTDLSSLRSGATDISSKIFDKLKGFAPANIITKIPVLAVTEIKTPVAATGVSTVADPVPNPIPPNVPLYQANSSQKKSIENMISVCKDAIDAKESELLSKLQNINTLLGLNPWVDERQGFASIMIKKIDNEITPLITKGSGDSALVSDLLSYLKKIFQKGYPLDNAFNAKYDELKAKGA